MGDDSPVAIRKAQLGRDMGVLRSGGLFGRGVVRISACSAYRPRSGDIVVRLLASPGSIGLASASLSGYSHCGVIRAVGDRAMAMVDDCFPPCDAHPGGPRRTPWIKWITREGEYPVVHWQVLRHRDMDPGLAITTLDDLSASRIRFTLVAEMADAPAAGGLGATGNCAAFVRAFLEHAGVDCTPAFAATEISRHVLTRFFRLIRQGFYARLPANAGNLFFEQARTYGLTRVEDWPQITLPAAFCELLPDFSPVAYMQNPNLPARTRHYALYAYRRLAPVLRTAMACHGLVPAQAAKLAARHGGSALARLVRAMPAASPIQGTRLAIDLLLDTAASPWPYVAIPQSAFLALTAPNRVTAALLALALGLTPPFLALARQIGWKPLRALDAGV